jgi:SpoVK/Ycf46/Vps4 family AAA+-type ATPase
VGDAPKNIEAAFAAALRDNALLFFDEADSLLSRRFTTITQGSEQAINSMRSQLLLCLERFTGVVVFATNLPENYDGAFLSRARHVHFPIPDENMRAMLWKKHLPDRLPLSEDVSIEHLSRVERVTGRQIRNAVIDAAVRAARSHVPRVSKSMLLESIVLMQQEESEMRDSSGISMQQQP